MMYIGFLIIEASQILEFPEFSNPVRSFVRKPNTERKRSRSVIAFPTSLVKFEKSGRTRNQTRRSWTSSVVRAYTRVSFNARPRHNSFPNRCVARHSYPTWLSPLCSRSTSAACVQLDLAVASLTVPVRFRLLHIFQPIIFTTFHILRFIFSMPYTFN